MLLLSIDDKQELPPTVVSRAEGRALDGDPGNRGAGLQSLTLDLPFRGKQWGYKMCHSAGIQINFDQPVGFLDMH